MVDGPGNPGNPDSPLSGAGLQDQHSFSLASSGISQVKRAQLVFLIGWRCLGWLCRSLDERVSFLSSSPGKGKSKDEMSFIGWSSQFLSPTPL